LKLSLSKALASKAWKACHTGECQAAEAHIRRALAVALEAAQQVGDFTAPHAWLEMLVMQCTYPHGGGTFGCKWWLHMTMHV